jgi:molybdate transport system substrate-binding protein
MRPRRLAWGLAALLGAMLADQPAMAKPPTLAAAADLKFAVEEIAGHFEAETGRPIRLVFGSSGNLFAQIQQGAPFELFMSADEDFVFKLADADLTEDRGELYAIGRIVLKVPAGSPLKADGTLEDLRAALADGRLTRFAIANPEHAPYGRRAEEALRHAGLWEAIQPKLVFGENVAQAAQFATSSSAQGGIIAYSLALAPAVAALGEHALIPQEWHAPLRQRMVLLKGASDTSRNFYAYMQEPAARAIMRRYGFVLPGEPVS